MNEQQNQTISNKYPVYMSPFFAEHIRRVLDHFMDDEAADYLETSLLEDREGHIYLSLKAIDLWFEEEMTLAVTYRRTKKLLTETLRKQLPPLNATKNDKDPIVQAKFYTPWCPWAWYPLEFDGEDRFFGLIQCEEAEWGYFSLSDLEAICGPAGLRVEHDDMHFVPTPISQIEPKLMRR